MCYRPILQMRMLRPRGGGRSPPMRGSSEMWSKEVLEDGHMRHGFGTDAALNVLCDLGQISNLSVASDSPSVKLGG